MTTITITNDSDLQQFDMQSLQFDSIMDMMLFFSEHGFLPRVHELPSKQCSEGMIQKGDEVLQKFEEDPSSFENV